MPSPYRPAALDPSDVFLKSEGIVTDKLLQAVGGLTVSGVVAAQMGNASSGNSINMVGSRTIRTGTVASFAALPAANTRSTGSTMYLTDTMQLVLNTGTEWVPLAVGPDTGSRQVKTLAENGWSAGDILLQRVGDLVELAVGGADPTNAAGNTRFLTLPSGFRPTGSRVLTLALRPATGSTPLYGQVQGAGGIVLLQTSGTSSNHLASVFFRTTDAFPTTLPGVAA